MMARAFRSTLKGGLLGLVFMTTACADLVVDNTNEPDRERALSDALAIESLITGSFQTWWQIQQGNTTRYLENAASVALNDALNYGNWDAAHEPRKEIINTPGYQWGYAIEDPFMIQNRALAGVREGLLMIEDGVQIGPENADAPRLRAFAKLMQGLFTANIALLYDKGWVVDEKTNTEQNVVDKKLVGYKDLMATARSYLAEARSIASQNSFETPTNWAAQSLSSDRLIRMANSYEARFMAAVARTPAERQAVDWNQVLTLINTGLTEDFGVNFDGPNGLWTQGSLKGISSEGSGISPRIAGPADQSGKWQAAEKVEPRVRDWFLVETDDRRIHAPGKPDESGTYLELLKLPNGTLEIHNGPDRGNWHQTPYGTTVWRTLTETDLGFAPDLSMKEMNLLKAEALIRLNRAAEAVPLINATRVANGGLPPVTVEGDKSARCVPRRLDGSCGDLMDALIYEKRLETLLLSGGLSFFDARGWGILLKGTALHFPVPALELNSLPMPIYTFGGQSDTENAAAGPQS